MIRFRLRGFKAPMLAAGLAASLLTACGPDTPGKAKAAEEANSAEAGYLAPPTLESAQRAGNRITLVGQGAPDSDIRLGSPTGEAVMGRVDAFGRWSLAVPNEPGVRLFGLSTTRGGRTVQAEGYIMVADGGEVALLRAGAGARRLTAGSSSPRILAVDVDREGGAVVSGVAAPGAGLNIRVDRVTRGGGRTDDDGRFFISLSDSLSHGPHYIQAGGDGGEDGVTIATSPAAPLVYGPVRADRTPMGWRIDWMTPGGGVQTTLLIGGETR
ncbi:MULTISPECIES: hypothetical protein [unclassified Caulobacter]|jgi:hypothetical protein|uniref:hypothetical protein n=1 Tax=unclassified Caulobacter TaxID=2648921 RepID=UPI0006FE779C|nr:MULTISPECIES: hypothetical protein [unclassified Caulobacter]KQV56917.1 hypothetical protein ASC62_11525 [Caulobacter sp. Root342]KQV72556.1 hypothetical protein ASC70_02475 [Caulobacter sp. Root343]